MAVEVRTNDVKWLSTSAYVIILYIAPAGASVVAHAGRSARNRED